MNLRYDYFLCWRHAVASVDINGCLLPPSGHNEQLHPSNTVKIIEYLVLFLLHDCLVLMHIFTH